MQEAFGSVGDGVDDETGKVWCWDMLGSVGSIDNVVIATSILPAVVLVLYFVGGFLLYLYKTKMGGCPDREMRERGSSLILGPFVRDFFAWLMGPLLRLLLASGLPANFVTTVALLLALGSGTALSMGYFALGGWLFLGSGFFDFLDGRIARVHKESCQSGALLDSVFDRYAEGAVFLGLTWFYHQSWILVIVLLAALGSQLVSYVRARCDAMGVDVSRVGLLQRPERIAVLGTTLCLSPLVEALIATSSAPLTHYLAITGLAFVAIMSNVTALQRLSYGVRVLQAPKELRSPELHREPGTLPDGQLP